MCNMRTGMDGLLCLYEATGNAEYVGYVVQYAKRREGKGQDVDGDGYLDWYSSWLDEASEGRTKYSHWHVEWRAADGIAPSWRWS